MKNRNYENKLILFFSRAENCTIDFHFFQFGLIWESTHWKKEGMKFKSPTIEKFQGKIDVEEIVSVQLGRNELGEIDWREADLVNKFEWRILRAVKFNRPKWAYFYFLGNLIGALNSGQIEFAKYKSLLLKFPNEFLVKNNIIMINLFNEFNEIDAILNE